MQLDDVVERVAHENLVGALAHKTLDLPIPDAAGIQVALGFLDVLDGEGDVRVGGVFLFAARHG